MTGELIGGRYQMLEQWQKNNSCQTHLAKDTHMPGNPHCVVKKLLLDDPALDDPELSSTYRRLFNQEVETLDMLGKHPQIPELKAHFEENGAFYLVQELIDGQDLSKSAIRSDSDKQQLTEDEVIYFLGDVLEILVFVHDNQVIHRDIKPSNLIRRQSDGKIVLIDFGAVKKITTCMSGRTITIGTRGYMPTEQIGGKPRFCSDIYALGITAIQFLTGVEPLSLRQDDRGEMVWRDRASVSGELADILDKMLRYNFRDRYQSAREVLDDLQQLRPARTRRTPTPTRTRKNPWMPYVGAAIGLVALVAAGLSLIIPHVNRTVQAIDLYDEANQLIDRGQYQKAIAAFDAALEIKSDFAEAWADRGYALGQLGQNEEKLRSCDRAILLDSNLPEAWICRGLARHSLQQYEEAIKDYDKALELDPNFSAAWYNKGETLLQLQERRAALRAFRKAIDIKPDYLFAWNLTCRAHYELREFSEAEIACLRALEIKSNYPPALQRLEWVRQKLGK